MTIAALLRHHGVHVPRYVTVNGQIVLDDVTSSALGEYSHGTFGTVTPVVRHTFHGGVEATDAASDPPHPWWANESEISRHIEAMNKAFPVFSFVPADGNLAPCWTGDLDTGRGKFKVAVILRRDRKLPRVAVLGGVRLGVPAGRRWRQPPHLYDNGNLCVADGKDWNPDVHTAATVTAWTAHWLAAYTEWRMSQRWPVEGAHADAA